MYLLKKVSGTVFFQDVKDDYVFECEAGNQYQKTKLTILQSLGDPLYYGKIQPCKEDEENDSQMSPSQWVLLNTCNWQN